jgi:hypothetical protein
MRTRWNFHERKVETSRYQIPKSRSDLWMISGEWPNVTGRNSWKNSMIFLHLWMAFLPGCSMTMLYGAYANDALVNTLFGSTKACDWFFSAMNPSGVLPQCHYMYSRFPWRHKWIHSSPERYRGATSIAFDTLKMVVHGGNRMWPHWTLTTSSSHPRIFTGF